MSKNDTGNLAFDHLPPNLKKAISERGSNQQQKPTPQTGNNKHPGDAKSKQ